MATLIINGDLTVLAPKVVRALRVRSLGTEDIAARCQTNRDVIRKTLSDLRSRMVVDHDGRRPRTWRLIDNVEWIETPARTVGSGSEWFQRSFTQEEDRAILRMREQGTRFVDIALAIGRRRDVVKNRYQVLKLKETEAA